MLYRNTPRFQALLQAALEVASQEKDYSDQKVVDEANLTCGKSTLNRFRRADLGVDLLKSILKEPDLPIEKSGGIFLKRGDAQRTWNHLDGKGLIEKTIALKGIHKQSLYAVREISAAVNAFYGTHRSSADRFLQWGMKGHFLCYKPSFRRDGFTVKSKMVFTYRNDEYFSVSETQRSSGIYEMDREGVYESSEGFGFIKSDRLWLMLRDIETEQPRWFCFNEPKFAGTRNTENPQNNRLTMFFGHLMEGAKGNAKNAFSFNTVLVAEEADKKLWTDEFPGEQYDIDQQIDIYPTAPEQRERYGSRKKFYIPDELVEYLDTKSLHPLRRG